MQTITKAILPVAGKGTRFLPATKSVAKEMFPIVDIPALMLVIEECMNSGITDVFIILSEEKKNIIDFLTKNIDLEELLKKSNKISYLDRLNKILDKMNFRFGYQDPNYIGSGGAIYQAKEWANNEPFAVLFADDLNYTPENKISAIGQLIKVYEKYHKLVIGCKEISLDEIYKYSACKITKKINDNLYNINGIVEKPKKGTEPSLISGLARYIMPANTFDYLEKQIQKREKGEEIGLTDTMDLILKDSSAYAVIMDSVRYDTGDKFGYLTAMVEYGLRDKDLGDKFKKYLKELKLF